MMCLGRNKLKIGYVTLYFLTNTMAWFLGMEILRFSGKTFLSYHRSTSPNHHHPLSTPNPQMASRASWVLEIPLRDIATSGLKIPNQARKPLDRRRFLAVCCCCCCDCCVFLPTRHEPSTTSLLFSKKERCSRIWRNSRILLDYQPTMSYSRTVVGSNLFTSWKKTIPVWISKLAHRWHVQKSFWNHFGCFWKWNFRDDLPSFRHPQ